MAVIVKCMGAASGIPMGYEGAFLKSYDLEANDGIGFVEFTSIEAEAMRFDDILAFFAVLKSSPDCKPLREDGKPKRPLTSTNWNIQTVD